MYLRSMAISDERRMFLRTFERVYRLTSHRELKYSTCTVLTDLTYLQCTVLYVVQRNCTIRRPHSADGMQRCTCYRKGRQAARKCRCPCQRATGSLARETGEPENQCLIAWSECTCGSEHTQRNGGHGGAARPHSH